ncbi:MAG: undecaprenyl/decaprenyl-phosphate alpha-N-acetylglucosaminyl 1-phosphate transferase, partial [Treponema sp.]|nr:undecaprenyl/decaprenyl-phosphate alpha-N-acetylglucosaminyl 1-phosphate transferase [Treponema sp.]
MVLGIAEYLLIILSFVLSFVFVKLTIYISGKENWYDEIDARKIHSGNIPRLGGLGLFLSFGITFCVYKLIKKDLDTTTLPILAGGFCIWLYGILDDFKNLRARLKFVIQILVIGAVVYFSPYYLKNILGLQLPVWFGKAITFFWILLLVNAFNLIDGIDWLCSGITLLSVLTLSFIFAKANSNIFVSLMFLSASILGFMYFNKPDAKIFLGDGGSQTLGYCVAVLPLLYEDSSLMYNKVLVMILFASIPVTDVIAAIWRRLRDKRSIFSTDRAHIHHKLLNIGFS